MSWTIDRKPRTRLPIRPKLLSTPARPGSTGPKRDHHSVSRQAAQQDRVRRYRADGPPIGGEGGRIGYTLAEADEFCDLLQGCCCCFRNAPSVPPGGAFDLVTCLQIPAACAGMRCRIAAVVGIVF